MNFVTVTLLVPDSNYLLACVRDDTIQLIDLRMNTIVRSFRYLFIFALNIYVSHS